MKILFVSAEVAPFAKVGGLADVAGSLPKALKALGHDVRLVMPAYQMVLDDYPCEVVRDGIAVQINPHWTKTAILYETPLGREVLPHPPAPSPRTMHLGEGEAIPLYLIGTDEWFTESDRSEKVYLPGAEQHLFFSQAVIEGCEALDWIPDVVHCNDWHTGLLPVFIREKAGSIWDETGIVFTIHNLAYQGEFGPEILEKAGLPSDLYNMHQLETFGHVNFLKAGCVYADQVNTVSPTYAREIQTPEFGCRLHGLMRHLFEDGRLRGILNGIDVEEFDPAIDTRIPHHFDTTDPSGKALCRRALLEELGLPDKEGAPLMGVVSRLSEQKGIDLMLQMAEEVESLPALLVIQGLGDPGLAEGLNALQERRPEFFRFVQKFDADLAQRIYAGCDMFLMPSRFEPCGLGQMIALRYGAIPVVRQTGGLADTVFEYENGFVFDELTEEQFLAALKRAHLAYQGDRWDDLVQTALRADHSWAKSALRYEEMYEEALTGRAKMVAVS